VVTDERVVRRGPGRPRGGAATTHATRESLLEAAYQSFSENGFHGTSMREVARICGISHAALLHHFPHKADLLIAVLDKRDSVFTIDLSDPSPLDEIFTDMVRGAQHNEEVDGLIRLYTVLAAEASDPAHPAHAYFVKRQTEFTTYLAVGIRRAKEVGTIHADTDPEELAIAITSLWDGLQVNAPYNRRIDIPKHLKAFFEAILGHGLDV
jgi:AcrR family transcriptional regulator